MGVQHSNMRKSFSTSALFLSPRESDSPSDRPRSLHESLMRERDKKHDFHDIYEVLDSIGEGGLCRIYKIQKKDEYIGGSSRPELVRRRHFLHRRIKSGGSDRPFRERTESFGTQLYYALKVINLKMVKEDKIDQLKNEVEYVCSDVCLLAFSLENTGALKSHSFLTLLAFLYCSIFLIN